MKRCAWFFVVAALAASQAAAQDPQKITFSGWGWMTAGQVMSSLSENALGNAYDMNFNKQWLVNYETGLKAVVQRGDRVKARLHLMTSLYYPVIRNVVGLSTAEPDKRSFFVTLLDAAIQSTWGMVNNRDTLFAEFGYLPVKYNPQSMNLGEYLFRSGTYPGYLVSGFELADKVKLTGLHLSYTLNEVFAGSLKQDVFFTNDMDVYPVNDFSLSYLADYTPAEKFLTVGAGVEFAHLIVVDPAKTDPYKNTERFHRYEPYVSTIDTAPPYDTTFYTFRGTKVMARLTLNPRVFLPGSFFGKEDLKLYGEAAILGVKNYKGWYGNLYERIPIMGGFNWPTSPLLSYTIVPGLFRYFVEKEKLNKYVGVVGGLGVLAGVGTWLLEQYTGKNLHPDILAVECELYGLKYWNTPEFIWRELTPRPYTGSTQGNISYYAPNSWTPKTDDDFRWSIYTSKKIGKSLRLSFQMASDHYSRSLWVPPTIPKYTEICTRTRDWYWMSRVMYYF